MTQFAVIKTGGKQYKVAKGDVLKIEKLAHDGKSIEFDQVLLVADSKKINVGRPVIDGAKVTAKIMEDGKDKKKRVFRYKSKTRQRTLKGHRQPYTMVQITGIAS